MQHLFFFIGLTFMLVHEMDAIRCREWRIFPGLSLLPQKIAMLIFLTAHIPLIFLLFRGIFGNNSDAFIHGMNIFFVVHLILHLLYLKHRKNEFKDWFSWTNIIGAALGGTLDLTIKYFPHLI